MVTRVLVVPGSPALGQRLQTLLQEKEIAPELVSVEELWETLSRRDFDLVLIERSVLPPSAEKFVARVQELPEHTGVVVLTSDEDPKERAELIAAGCLAVLPLGLEDGELGEVLAALIRRHARAVLDRLGTERAEKRSTLDEFVSRSPAMQRFVRVARRLVRGDSALLILGETGVGKERLARSSHSESRRSSGPFITVNCGALPESLLESELFGHEEGAFTGATRARRGYFELAHRGTIFLDEIGEMPLHLQVKLLRVLEDRRLQRVGGERPLEVDVRVIAASNRDLKAEMEANRFRADLYFRLAVVTLTVPPLRERREDIPELARVFLDRFRRQLGRSVTRIRPEAMEALLRYDWPGNVRELMNVIERAVLLSTGPEIDLADLRGEEWSGGEQPSEPSSEGPGQAPDPLLERPLAEARREVLDDFERRYLRRLLQDSGGRVGDAAKRAGVNPRSLFALLKRHGLRKEEFKTRRRPAP